MKRLGFGVSLLLAIQLGACGGGGVNSTPTPSAGPSPTPSPAPSPTPTPTPPASTVALPAAVQAAIAAEPLRGNYASSAGYGLRQAISYDAASGVYTYYTTDDATALKLPAAAAVAGALPGYTYFKVADPRAAGATDLVAVYNSGTNAMALTYASFAFAQIDPAVNSSQLQAYVFGSQTSTLPKTGSASYSGTVAGSARDSGGAVFLLKGSSTLSANFATGAYSTTLEFTGVKADGSTGLSSQSFSGVAGGFTLNGSPLNGNLTGSGSGTWGGKFFGPNAEEFGYTFVVNGSNYSAIGVAAGKKN